MTILFQVASGVICRDPQGLKPAPLLALGGTAEAVPFPFVGEGVGLFAALKRCATQRQVPDRVVPQHTRRPMVLLDGELQIPHFVRDDKL